MVLSAQATDAGVNKATDQLFKVADTPEKMLTLGEAKVRDYIKTIGLYRNKAKNVIVSHLRTDESWVNSQVHADHTVVIPVWRSRNLVANQAEPRFRLVGDQVA